jgi:hypothetical protein
MNTARPALLTLLLTIALHSAEGDWRVTAETGATYDSNLSNSDRASEEENDWAWRSVARIENGFQLSRDLRLDLGADLRGWLWNEFDGFDEIGTGASVALRYRFGLGRQAPWLLLNNRIGYDQFREDFRSGWDELLQLRGGLAVSERVALEAGYTFENVAVAGRFFDRQSNSVDVRGIIDATSALQIGIGYSYRYGDVISYSPVLRPDIFQIASARKVVPTFGSDPFYTAYKLRGDTHAVSVFAGYALTKYLSIQVSYEYAATSHDSLHYHNHFVETMIAFAY